MFGPMLDAVAAERDNPVSPEVGELLGRMHATFGGHRTQTAEHVAAFEQRLADLGSGTASARVRSMSAGARGWVAVTGFGGQNHGSNARNAFVFEHLEIAELQLLEALAERAGDEETADLARRCRADDEEMAATINRNWTNVLILNLAG